MKICSKCGRELDDSCFYKDERTKSGLSWACKECTRKYAIEYAIEHKEQANEALRRYREKHRERYNEHQREYRRNRREKYPDIIREQKRKSYLLHREDILNKRKNRMKNDELFKFKNNLRSLIVHSLKRNGFEKDTSTQDILGCSLDEAKTHLEETWFKNYGTIYNGEPAHIDHIIPLATAKTKEEVVRLCHISNLQYLKPEDNLRKCAKLEYEITL